MLKQGEFRETSCRICYDRRTNLYYALPKGLLWRCENCRAVFFEPAPPASEICYHKDWQFEPRVETKRKNFKRWLSAIQRLGPPPKKLLDAGCGMGFFLEEAMAMGYEGFGIERAEEVRPQLRPDIASRVWFGDFLSWRGDEFFDIVVLLDSLEHFPQCGEAFRKAVSLLKPGGLLVINTPNPDSLWARLMGRFWTHWHTPDHYCFLSPATLRWLAAQSGLSVLMSASTFKCVTVNYMLARLNRFNPRIGKVLDIVTGPIRAVYPEMPVWLPTMETFWVARKH